MNLKILKELGYYYFVFLLQSIVVFLAISMPAVMFGWVLHSQGYHFPKAFAMWLAADLSFRYYKRKNPTTTFAFNNTFTVFSICLGFVALRALFEIYGIKIEDKYWRIDFKILFIDTILIILNLIILAMNSALLERTLPVIQNWRLAKNSLTRLFNITSMLLLSGIIVGMFVNLIDKINYELNKKPPASTSIEQVIDIPKSNALDTLNIALQKYAKKHCAEMPKAEEKSLFDKLYKEETKKHQIQKTEGAAK